MTAHLSPDAKSAWCRRTERGRRMAQPSLTDKHENDSGAERPFASSAGKHFAVRDLSYRFASQAGIDDPRGTSTVA